MTDLLPFIVIGITTGAVYGLAGTGLVLTYKTSGIFNFAYGSLAALTVFVFYFLHTEHGWPWPLAALFCLFVLAPIEGLLLELFARSLEDVSRHPEGGGHRRPAPGRGRRRHPLVRQPQHDVPPVPATDTIRFFGVNVAWYQIIVVIISVVATAVLYYFFRFVRMGIAMRGVVDNPDLVSMAGENPVRVRRWAWIISTIFASLAGPAPRPDPHPGRPHHHHARRPGLRSGGHRLLLEPPADLPRRPDHRCRRRLRHQVHGLRPCR